MKDGWADPPGAPIGVYSIGSIATTGAGRVIFPFEMVPLLWFQVGGHAVDLKIQHVDPRDAHIGTSAVQFDYRKSSESIAQRLAARC